VSQSVATSTSERTPFSNMYTENVHIGCVQSFGSYAHNSESILCSLSLPLNTTQVLYSSGLFVRHDVVAREIALDVGSALIDLPVVAKKARRHHAAGALPTKLWAHQNEVRQRQPLRAHSNRTSLRVCLGLLPPELEHVSKLMGDTAALSLVLSCLSCGTQRAILSHCCSYRLQRDQRGGELEAVHVRPGDKEQQSWSSIPAPCEKTPLSFLSAFPMFVPSLSW
jgi:hypothetical protein